MRDMNKFVDNQLDAQQIEWEDAGDITYKIVQALKLEIAT